MELDKDEHNPIGREIKKTWPTKRFKCWASALCSEHEYNKRT